MCQFPHYTWNIQTWFWYVIFIILYLIVWICSLQISAHEPPLCRLALWAMVLWYFYSPYFQPLKEFNEVGLVWAYFASDHGDISWYVSSLMILIARMASAGASDDMCVIWAKCNASLVSIDPVIVHSSKGGAFRSNVLFVCIKGPSLVPDRALFHKGVFIASFRVYGSDKLSKLRCIGVQAIGVVYKLKL